MGKGVLVLNGRNSFSLQVDKCITYPAPHIVLIAAIFPLKKQKSIQSPLCLRGKVRKSLEFEEGDFSVLSFPGDPSSDTVKAKVFTILETTQLLRSVSAND